MIHALYGTAKAAYNAAKVDRFDKSVVSSKEIDKTVYTCRPSLSSPKQNVLNQFLSIGGSTQLPARKIRSSDMSFLFPKRDKGLSGVIPICMKPESSHNIIHRMAMIQRKKANNEPFSQHPSSILPNKSLFVQNELGDQLINNLSLQLPKLIPPLVMGYLIWENNGLSCDLYNSIYNMTIDNLSIIDPIRVGLEEQAQKVGGANSNELTQSLLNAANKAREEIQYHAAATQPSSNSPSKIAVWIAGILLAVAIASMAGDSDQKC